ncbi:AAA domain-containing protein [Curtobacterium sp. AG1037]|uniref:AAA family ATPase n=1 Tax=Curtobacterium sp. AG1037 TaxID=2183990 RepID=UPI000E0AC8AC|nr:AAA family ATPase [Curtobacterium sp. AG1037]RDH95762.1 AAA domain-containing protein [Curtobacterium sp. AG1037]
MAVERGPRTWIITGMPGAGKSTVSRGLAGALPRAARVAADNVGRMIRSGAVWPLGHPEDEAARQVALCHRNIGALTTNFVTAGFDTVVDCVLPDAHHLDHLVGVLPQVPTFLVVLAPGGATCRARNAARPSADRFEFDGHEALDRSMRDGFRDQGWWIDTASQSVDETVRLVVEHAVVGDRGRIAVHAR